MQVKVISIDTNAVFDLCYRFYKQDLFPSVWTQLDTAIQTRQIHFVMSNRIYEELQGKLEKFYPTNKDVCLNFLSQYVSDIVNEDDYGGDLLTIQAEMKKIRGVTDSKLVSANKDLNLIASAVFKECCVLTSEQGGQNLTALKIPDVCSHQQVECWNWLDLFEYIGLRG